MPGIVEFPTIVRQAAQQFGAVFANEPERRHFAEYLTGLLVAAKKNVSGINAEFAQTTAQSCLNRWITEVVWDEVELNRQRLEWLQQDPHTRYAPDGVIPIDNTLVDHDGKLIEDVGYFWDHAEERYKIAHDYLIANYVCRSGKHYALEFRRFRKQADCEAKRAELEARAGGFESASAKEQRLATFKNHTVLCGELIDWVVEQEIPGTFAFDSYFTNAPVCNRIDAHSRAYVGDLKFNRKVGFRGREMRVDALAAQIPLAARKYERINETLIEIEERSGKRLKKWSRARFDYRLAYIEAVIAQPLFRELIFFSHYTGSQDYFKLTVETAAKAIHHKDQENHPATVIVDGLRGRDVDRFKTSLRQLHVNVRKVRGARDESEPIIRLADAVAGFVRDFLEGQNYAAKLYEKAIREGIFQEL